MRSLFLKIFLWFWLAMVLVTLTLLISSFISESRSSREGDEVMDRTMTPLVADNFVEMFDREGLEGYTALVRRGQDAYPWDIFLFDEHGTELTGRLVPSMIRAAFDRALVSRQTEIVYSGASRAVGQWIRGNSGKANVVVLNLKPRGPAPFLQAPSQVQILRVVVIVLIIGAVCLWITRHITRPILELREAANQLASGRLKTRVGPSSAGRADELGDLSRDFNHMAEHWNRSSHHAST